MSQFVLYAILLSIILMTRQREVNFFLDYIRCIVLSLICCSWQVHHIWACSSWTSKRVTSDQNSCLTRNSQTIVSDSTTFSFDPLLYVSTGEGPLSLMALAQQWQLPLAFICFGPLYQWQVLISNNLGNDLRK